MKYLLKIFTVIFALLACITQALSLDDVVRKIKLQIAENIVKQTVSIYLHNLALPGAQEKKAQQHLDKLLAYAFRSFENDVSTQNQDVLQQIIIQNQGLLNGKKSLKEILESSSDQEQNFQKLSEVRAKSFIPFQITFQCKLITNQLIRNIEKSDNKQATVERVIEDVKSYFREVEGFTDEDFEKIMSQVNIWISNSQDNKEKILRDALTSAIRDRKSANDIIDGVINQIVKNQIGEQKIAELLSQIQQQRQVVEKKTPEQNTQQEQIQQSTESTSSQEQEESANQEQVTQIQNNDKKTINQQNKVYDNTKPNNSNFSAQLVIFAGVVVFQIALAIWIIRCRRRRLLQKIKQQYSSQVTSPTQSTVHVQNSSKIESQAEVKPEAEDENASQPKRQKKVQNLQVQSEEEIYDEL